MTTNQPIRPRRNRTTAAVRGLVRETELQVRHLIYPYFILPGENRSEPIPSMPGIARMTTDLMLADMAQCMEMGLCSFILFPVVPEEWKDATASYSFQEGNFYVEAIAAAKKQFPGCCIVTDVALDPYSSDGHDGLVREGQILNDETLPILGKMALLQAQAGADLIGPSDMMDGRVGYIRAVLDEAGFTNTGIMSYTAKYASGFYGPFRDALESAPKFGDKKTYQMDPANRLEALREAELDEAEGADFLMVKPALSYLDVIRTLKDQTALPIAAYNVSGEYAMVKAAAEKGWLDHNRIVDEILLSIHRAGAEVVISYHAKDWAIRHN